MILQDGAIEVTESYFFQGRLDEARAAYLDHLAKIKDVRLREEVAKAKKWVETLPVCKLCGDRAMIFSELNEKRMRYCEDCWEEMSGRSNGSKQLRGKAGGSGVRLGSDYASDGPSGRMGHYGVGGGMMDDIVRAAEDDR